MVSFWRVRWYLESFSLKVFPHFRIANVFANLDRFQGGDHEVSEVVELIRGKWPNATIRCTPTPSFTGAVMWLWRSALSRYALHLEDDWFAEQPITPDMVFPHFVGSTKQVSILTFEKSWKSGFPFHCRSVRRRFLGVPIGWRLFPEKPVFTTSPSFVEREFAHNCARLMDTALDPEKQLYSGSNVALSSYTAGFRNRLIRGSRGFLITDIGRQHNAAINVEKRIIGGRTIWLSKPPGGK